MRETLEGKLEWARVISTGAPLALALLDLGEGLTDAAIMTACQEDDAAARAVAVAELVRGLERLLEVLDEVDARGDAEGRSDAVQRCAAVHATSQTTPPTRCATTRRRDHPCTMMTTSRPSAWTYAAPSSPRMRARCSG
jgi:hypothetical protein